ncbi:hypothetical protein SM124_06775 [Bacillus sp. 31A1R]|uniref:Histidine kinase N-terminal 7TM region domain-containing protein n=1 Tax=Robertmurraya mangrovi TaxID=3098077 RepID=A0ABU5IWA9_9BACI|nr:hypothetical protein [Bacillus sp. 31A1R]MDZ5471448.1 hypothetical protein [Bacillus sp. 31A1R]
MQTSIFIDLIILSSICFIFKKKRFHAVQYLYVYLIIVFLYCSFISVISDNLELWKVKEQIIPYIVFRVSEVILFPLVALWFIELFHLKSNKMYKITLISLFLLIPVLLQQWLVYMKVFEYRHWEVYKTILVWIIFYSTSVVTNYLVGKHLVKEGVINDSAPT